MFDISYLGAREGKGDHAAMGPLYEIRKGEVDFGPLRDQLRWGREHHSKCSGGFRVPVLHIAYVDMKYPVREVLKDAPIVVGYLLRVAALKVALAAGRVQARLERFIARCLGKTLSRDQG